MSQSLKLVKEFGGVSSTYGVSSPKATITQTGAGTSGVTLTAKSGIIVTTTVATATLGSFSFIASNANITPSTIVNTSLQGYGGTGIPIVSATSVTAGSFTVVVNNAHPTTALSAGMKISYDFY